MAPTINAAAWRERRRRLCASLASPGSIFFCCLLCFLFLGAFNAPAALQFDVFPGYDGIVSEASWFPVVIEVDNDGPTFMGLVEITGGMGNSSQPVRLGVELPSGTLKRLVIPLFSSSYSYGGIVNLDVRLYDERGRVRAEQVGVRARRQAAVDVPVLGSLARNATGTPVIRPVLPQDTELQPGSARFLPTIFPDNPLVLEGMDALYLNSAKAAELGVTQVEALLNWLHAGGHLIIGVEQISEISSAAWLKEMFPCSLKDIRPVETHGELQDWLKTPGKTANLPQFRSNHRVRLPRNGPMPAPDAAEAPIPTNPFGDLPNDPAFETNALQVAVGELRDGKALVSAGDTPLIVTANRGRGRLTVLLFSPEREPFRSWKNQPTFWAKLLGVPTAWYASPDIARPSGWSTDAVFGAMVDTRQVHKLPVGWLLVLLVVYLVVIGPLDQYWLKSLGKPMLTWITFPCYVVLFSLLIYFIGYKLRAGESEWNELNVVDVLPRGDGAQLRGRTYASIYSPVNQKYLLQGQQQFSTLRGEFAGTFMGPGQANAERTTVWQNGDGFKAEIFVPVWTSQLFVNDWLQPADAPLGLTVTPADQGWQATVENHTSTKLTNLRMVIDTSIYELGELGANETKKFTVAKDKGTALADFVTQYGRGFQEAIQSRSATFAGSGSGHLDDLPECTTAVSFISQLAGQQHFSGGMPYPQMNYSGGFVSPPGLDLTPLAGHDYAILLAWAGDYSPGKSICQFSPRRLHRDTLWRLAVPLK